MRLWTWHGPDFSLVDGVVDHNKSSYAGLPNLLESYRELWQRVGTDQLIWCYTAADERIVSPCHTALEWILDVPDSAILCFIDTLVWNRILGIRCDLTNSLKSKFKTEAVQKHPNNTNEQRRYVAESTEAFWDQAPPKRGWWSVLFASPQEPADTSALIQHPVPSDWVVLDPRRS